MPDLKPGWRRVKFADIAENVNDRVDDPSQAGVDRYVGLEHLDPESLTIRRWGTPDEVESTKLRFRPGDIIFGKRRAYQRKLAVADFHGICSAHAMVLRAKPGEVAAEFLPFFMQSDTFMDRALAISVGSLSPTINWRALAVEEFMLPSVEEQRRLAKGLTDAESAIQNLLDAASAANEVAEAFSGEMFRGPASLDTVAHPRLGQVARNWNVRSIGDIIENSQYGLSTAPQESGEFPILRMMNLVNGVAVENDIRFVDLGENVFQNYRLEHGDVLFNRTNSIDLVGRTGVYTLAGDHVFASYLVRLRVKRDMVSPEYLTEYLNGPLGRQQVLSFATKAVSQANVSASNLAKVLIPLPPRPAQDRIVADLAKVKAATEDLMERVKIASQLKYTMMLHLSDNTAP